MSKRVKKFMSVKMLLVLTTLLSLYPKFSVAAQSSAEIANQTTSKEKTKPWKVWRTDDDLKVSYRDSSVKNLIEIKAQAKLKSSLAGFIYFIEDLQQISYWLDNATSAEIISQRSSNKNTFITNFKGLWPVSAREMIIHSRYWQNHDLSLEIAVKDAGDAMVKTKNKVRMQVYSAHWKIVPTEHGQIDITYQFIVDPKGNIPQWLTKTMTLKGIWTTLNNLRAQLPKSKWQQHTKENIQELN